MSDTRFRGTPAIAVLVSLLLLAGCANKTFNVKVQPKIAPESVGPAAGAPAFTARASAKWDEDWLLDNFDANLVLARVLAVQVVLENRGGVPVPAKKLKLALLPADGRSLKLLKPKKAMKAIESYYGVALQSKSGRKLYQADFLANALDLETPVAPGEARQGFVFFELPAGVSRPVPLTFGVRSKSGDIAVSVPAN